MTDLENLRKKEIEESRSAKKQTLRATVDSLEDILYAKLPVLDHGFIRVIDYMGDDNAVVQAARVSYGQGTKKVNEDKGLIRYLMRHHHTTPFEMCEIKFHIKLPIFVARQWIRHRTANVNEYSARYSILAKEFYIPKKEHLAAQSISNRQGREEKNLSEAEANRVLQILHEDSERCYKHYSEMLNQDDQGNVIDESKACLARELARMNLNLNYYTEWYWKTDLHNLFHFARLRADSHAQYEIRAYADVIMDILQKWVPFSYEAFSDYRIGAVNVSAKGIDVIKRLINGEKVTQETSELNKREWSELMTSLKL